MEYTATIQVSWKTHYFVAYLLSMHQILPESAKFYEKITNTSHCVFSVHSALLLLLFFTLGRYVPEGVYNLYQNRLKTVIIIIT